jgi:hypothetical protein
VSDLPPETPNVTIRTFSVAVYQRDGVWQAYAFVGAAYSLAPLVETRADQVRFCRYRFCATVFAS